MTTDSTLNDTGLYSRYRGLSLGVKILIWMGLGIVAGILFGNDAEVVQPIGDLFIRLLFMSAIPLVFFNLIAGVTSLANFTTLGRLKREGSSSRADRDRLSARECARSMEMPAAIASPPMCSHPVWRALTMIKYDSPQGDVSTAAIVKPGNASIAAIKTTILDSHLL